MRDFNNTPRRNNSATPDRTDLRATVKWYNDSKGFGFAEAEDGSGDIFVHATVLQQSGHQALNEGDKLVLDTARGERGPQALRLHSVTPGDASARRDRSPSGGRGFSGGRDFSERGSFGDRGGFGGGREFGSDRGFGGGRDFGDRGGFNDRGFGQPRSFGEDRPARRDFGGRPDQRNSGPSLGTVEGTVKWYNATKGFGFAAPDNGDKDIFIHVSALQRSGLDGLAEGERVSMDIRQGQKGPEASAVRRA